MDLFQELPQVGLVFGLFFLGAFAGKIAGLFVRARAASPILESSSSKTRELVELIPVSKPKPD